MSKTESAAARAKRLAGVRAYTARKRAKESPADREHRLALDRKRRALARSNESPAARKRRLDQGKAYRARVASVETPEAIESRRRRARERESQKYSKVREIGPIPAVADRARRDCATYDFTVFLNEYLNSVFRAVGVSGVDAILDRATAAVHEGVECEIEVRNSGIADELSVAVALWASLTGKRQGVFALKESRESCATFLDRIRFELRSNRLLAADFPEVCWIISSIGGISQRRPTLDGRTVDMELSRRAKFVRLPAVGSSAGAVISALPVRKIHSAELVSSPDLLVARARDVFGYKAGIAEKFGNVSLICFSAAAVKGRLRDTLSNN